MSKRIRRLPASFDDPQAGGTTGAAADGPDADQPAEGPASGPTEHRDPAKDSSG
jgi:hypothetical protein